MSAAPNSELTSSYLRQATRSARTVISHIDARTGVGPSALVRFEDAAVMFSAVWGEPSVEVPRPDGSRRRQYVVRLAVPPAHQHRPFHLAHSITLYPGVHEPLASDDFAGVHARHSDEVTLAWFIKDEPSYVFGGVGAEPSMRPAAAPSKSTTGRKRRL